jgi:hypothetical protein
VPGALTPSHEKQQGAAESSAVNTATRHCCILLHIHRATETGLRRSSSNILNAFNLTCGRHAMSLSPDTLLELWEWIYCHQSHSPVPEHAFNLHPGRQGPLLHVFSCNEEYGLTLSWNWGITDRCNPGRLFWDLQTKPVTSILHTDCR